MKNDLYSRECTPRSASTAVCEVPTMGPLHAILNCSTWGPRSSTREVGSPRYAKHTVPFDPLPVCSDVWANIETDPPRTGHRAEEIFDGCACRHCREGTCQESPKICGRQVAIVLVILIGSPMIIARRVELQKTRAAASGSSDATLALIRRQTAARREILYRLVTNLFLASLHKLNRCRVVGTVEMNNQLRVGPRNSRATYSTPSRNSYQTLN